MTTLDTFFSKLSPKLVAALLIGALLFTASTVVFAVLSGRTVDMWGLKIEADAAPPVTEHSAARDDTCAQDLASSRHELASLQRQADTAIVRSEISDLWPAELAKADVIAALRAKAHASECADDDTAECLYAKILNRIGESGGAVDPMQAPKSTVLLIQKALIEVGAYHGALDGDAAATKRSLIAFQRRHRIRTNTDTIEGLMGRKTLEKIRMVRQAIVDGT